MSVAFVSNILAILTIFAQVVIVILFISFFLPAKTRKPLADFLAKYTIVVSFLIALTATIGSLFYSEIAGYEPCKLCWFERIFMYPQTILFGIALWKKDKGIADYGIALSVIGALISGYHYLLQRGVTPSAPCSAVGYSVNCSKVFVMQYGYITIPLMALTAFLFILFLMISFKIYKKK